MFPPPTERQAKLMWFAASAVAVTVIIAVLCVLIWGLGLVLQTLSPVLWPLAVAGVLAYLLDPVVDFLERHRVPRTRAILVVFALAAAVLMGLVGSVVPAVVSETRALVEQSDQYRARVEKKLDGWMNSTNSLLRRALTYLPGFRDGDESPRPGEGAVTGDTNEVVPGSPTNNPGAETDRLLSLSNTTALEVSAPVEGATNGEPPPLAAEGPTVSTSLDGVEASPGSAGAESVGDGRRLWERLVAQGHVESATRWLASIIPTFGRWIFGQVTMVASWFGVLAGLALIPVYLFYFLLEKRGISSHWTNYLPVADSRLKEELVVVISSINDYLIAFFRGQVLVAICDGVLYTIGFLAIGLPMAVLLGVVGTVLTVIPYLGAIVTCGSALVIAAIHFGDITHPLLVLVVFAFVQGLEGLLIQPKIVGDRVGLHPLTIIVALMVGTALFGGLLGGILAIPFTAAFRVLMFRYVWKKPAAAPAKA